MEWRAIKGVPEGYEVSSTGLVRRNGVLRKLQHHLYGYTAVYITVPHGQMKLYVHRLVAAAFLPLPQPGQEIDHIDGDPTNNSVENLRWVERGENARRRRAPNTVDRHAVREAARFASITKGVDGRVKHGRRRKAAVTASKQG